MLAQTVMSVVIVIAETITLCILKDDGWEHTFTGVSTFKSATETSPGRNDWGGTGKPHKLETQNW